MTAGDVDPSRHVLVPNRPGALVPLADQAPKRGRDDLDELIDDLLPDVDEGPGVFDVALVVIGLALIGWTVLGSGPGWAVLVGLGAFALGVTLPARALVRRFQSRSRRRHLAGQLDQGTLLDVTTSEVSALTSAHAELLAITERMEAGLGSQVREAVLSPRATVAGAEIERAVLLDGVEVGRGAVLRNTIIDKNVIVPPGLQIGVDPAADLERFGERDNCRVTDSGIVVIGKNDDLSDLA